MKAVLLFVALLTQTALAQSGSPAEAPVPALSPAAEVSLLTMLPGDEVYSLFGHTALRIHDPALGLDRAYNYGTFDFDQPYFVARFARGLLDYQLSVSSTERTIAAYRTLERPVIEQHLDLTPEARQDLFQFLETNYRPENRAYRYDFFFDNCSTRPRDAVERALGGRLAYPGYTPSGETFRDLLQPYLEGAPLIDFGIDLGLGAPTDRHATDREAMFLPIELMEAFDAASVDGRPLVARRDTVFWIEGAGLPEEDFGGPTAAAWLLLILGAALTAAAWRGQAEQFARRFDAALFGIVGFAGTVLAWLWLGTEHAVTGPNWNLLWAVPTHLVAAVFFARRNPPEGLRVYGWATSVLASATVLLWPFWPQTLHPAVAPLALLLALRAGSRAIAARPAPSPST